MKPKVYIKTSIPSYLTAWRSRDIVTAGNQETTKEWWARREDFDLYVSVFVREEVAAGDKEASELRVRALDGIPEIEITEQVEIVAEQLITRASLPA